MMIHIITSHATSTFNNNINIDNSINIIIEGFCYKDKISENVCHHFWVLPLVISHLLASIDIVQLK